MRTTVALAAGLCVLVAAAAILAFGPVPSLDGTSGPTDETTPTVTPEPETTTVVGTASPGSLPGQPSTGTSTVVPPTTTIPPAGPTFDFAIDSIDTCGDTCRIVTGTLTNNQSSSASNVSVDLRLYPGNDTEGGPVWNATEPVGSLEPSASVSVTRQVNLSTPAAFAVSRNDGWVTVLATIRSDGRTVKIEKQRDVL